MVVFIFFFMMLFSELVMMILLVLGVVSVLMSSMVLFMLVYVRFCVMLIWGFFFIFLGWCSGMLRKLGICGVLMIFRFF